MNRFILTTAALVLALPAAGETAPSAVLRTLRIDAGSATLENVEQATTPHGDVWEGEWKQPDGMMSEARVTPDGALLLRETHITADALPPSVRALVKDSPETEIERIEVVAYEITVIRDGEEHELLVLPDGRRISKNWIYGGSDLSDAEDMDDHNEADDDEADDDEADDDTPVAVADLPAPIAAQLKTMFPRATLIEAQNGMDDGRAVVEVEFKTDGRTYEATFGEGHVLQSVELDNDGDDGNRDRGAGVDVD